MNLVLLFLMAATAGNDPAAAKSAALGRPHATTAIEVPAGLKQLILTRTASSPAGCCSGGGAEKAGCCESRPASNDEGCCEHDDDAPRAKTPAKTEARCTLSTESRAVRQKVLAELKRDVVERKDLADGISLRFKAGPGVLPRLAQIVDLERQCCQFLRFAIRGDGSSDSVWLDLTASGEGKALIKEYFGDR
jgi:hypothetical protein